MLAIGMASTAASMSSANAQQSNFFDRKAEGWFWYQDPAEIEEIPEEKPLPIPQPTPVPPQPAATATQEPEAEVFSTVWLRESMPKYLEQAIDDPSPENVRAYMYLQRIMMDKAELFAQSTQRAVMGDPFLDESVRRPLASFAVNNLDQKAGRATTALVEQIAQQAGIFFFFRSDCQLCEIQAPLIKNLQDHLGFAVVPISLDGKNLRESPWENIKVDNGQAESLNVQALPAMYLASADGEFELIGQSAYALTELKDRILLAARRKGWISQDDFNQTRPIANFTNLASMLNSAEKYELLKGADPADKGANPSFIPSKRLMEYIDSKLELPE